MLKKEYRLRKNADFRKLNNPKLSILKKILYFHNFHLK